MRYFDTDKNVADYVEYGWNKKLPKDLREKLNGKTLKVEVSSYPFYHKDDKGSCRSKTVEVESPTTYSDIIDAYVDYIYEIDEIAKTDAGWHCNHTADCLWVEEIGIDAENLTAEVNVGS